MRDSFIKLTGDNLSPIPIVQQKKKYATFTVSDIGGPAELVKWREEQAKKWEHSQAMREQFKDKQKAFLAAGAPEGEKITWSGKGETTTRDWEEKLGFALSERKRLAKAETFEPRPYEHVVESEPKKTVFQRIKQWFVDLWRSANF